MIHLPTQRHIPAAVRVSLENYFGGVSLVQKLVLNIKFKSFPGGTCMSPRSRAVIVEHSRLNLVFGRRKTTSA